MSPDKGAAGSHTPIGWFLIQVLFYNSVLPSMEVETCTTLQSTNKQSPEILLLLAVFLVVFWEAQTLLNAGSFCWRSWGKLRGRSWWKDHGTSRGNQEGREKGESAKGVLRNLEVHGMIHSHTVNLTPNLQYDEMLKEWVVCRKCWRVEYRTWVEKGWCWDSHVDPGARGRRDHE